MSPTVVIGIDTTLIFGFEKIKITNLKVRFTNVTTSFYVTRDTLCVFII